MVPASLNEASLEELIVAQMVARRRRAGLGARATQELQRSVLPRPHGVPRIHPRHPAHARRHARPRWRLTDDAQVPRPAAGRDHQERRRRMFCETASTHGQHHIDLYYPTPRRAERQGRSAVRGESVHDHATGALQPKDAGKSLDLVAFVNGLPIATFELKNHITKQTVEDAVKQYKTDRDPRELIFAFGRCMAHFAVDDQHVRFCARSSAAPTSWFLPFDQGHEDGAGNPPNPDGVMTDYLWRQHPRTAQPRGHHRELRRGRDDEGPEDGQEDRNGDLPALPPARRGADAARRRRGRTAPGIAT